MLETLAKCPVERLDCISWNHCVLSIDGLIGRCASYFLVGRWHISVLGVCLRLVVSGVLFVTVLLYVYFVYSANLKADDHLLSKKTATD